MRERLKTWSAQYDTGCLDRDQRLKYRDIIWNMFVALQALGLYNEKFGSSDAISIPAIKLSVKLGYCKKK